MRLLLQNLKKEETEENKDIAIILFLTTAEPDSDEFSFVSGIKKLRIKVVKDMVSRYIDEKEITTVGDIIKSKFHGIFEAGFDTYVYGGTVGGVPYFQQLGRAEQVTLDEGMQVRRLF